MNLPEHPHLFHLKKQAKQLLSSYRQADPEAIKRFLSSLPQAAGKSPAELQNRKLRLHDAQSCIAREYGFASWSDLASYVESKMRASADRSQVLKQFLAYAYGFGYDAPRPRLAARLLGEYPDLLAGDPYLACARGDVAAMERAIASDSQWPNRRGGPLQMPPLVAVAHSALVRVPEFEQNLLRSATLLLDRGADPNQN